MENSNNTNTNDNWILTIFGILLAIAIVFVVGSWFEQNDKLYQTKFDKLQQNIGGNLQLLNIDIYKGKDETGSINGSLLSNVDGQYQGKSETMVRFSWRGKNQEDYISEVPISCFIRVKPNEKYPQMTINFDLKTPILLDDLSHMKTTELVEKYLKFIKVSMTDGQYTEFLKNTK